MDETVKDYNPLPATLFLSRKSCLLFTSAEVYFYIDFCMEAKGAVHIVCNLGYLRT